MLWKPSGSAQTLHSSEERPKSGYPRPPAFSRPQKAQRQAKTCQQALHHTVIAGLPPTSRPHRGEPQAASEGLLWPAALAASPYVHSCKYLLDSQPVILPKDKSW